jgi:hypothetical protein
MAGSASVKSAHFLPAFVAWSDMDSELLRRSTVLRTMAFCDNSQFNLSKIEDDTNGSCYYKDDINTCAHAQTAAALLLQFRCQARGLSHKCRIEYHCQSPTLGPVLGLPAGL